MKNINNYISNNKKNISVNISRKIRKLQTTYGRDNTKQAEMSYFHFQGRKNFNQITSKGRKFNIKNKQINS